MTKKPNLSLPVPHSLKLALTKEAKAKHMSVSDIVRTALLERYGMIRKGAA